MSVTAENLLGLLPAVYGRRDGDDGPLRELLDVVAGQIAVLEDGNEQLYDDQFVETCAPWALPYMGELLGLTGLPAAPLTPRAEVAHTIAYRRRKGTAAVLEQLARDITGLPARAVEFFELLAATQNLNHLRLGGACPGFAAVGDQLSLERLGGPFERLPGPATLTHSVDVRRIGSGRGRYNIANVGIFLWRLREHSLTDSPASADGPGKQRRFRFSPLGNDAPLFSHGESEDELTHLAEPRNVPAPISRREAAADPAQLERSFQIEVGGKTVAGEELAICDLSSWNGPAGKVAVDPQLGRIVLKNPVEAPPRVSFRYGFAASIGGGEYLRALASEADGVVVRRVEEGVGAIQAAIDDLPANGGVVEIGDSGSYQESGLALVAKGRRVVLRAAVGARPTVVLDGNLTIAGDPDGTVVIDGLVLSGGGVEVGAGPGGDGLGVLEIRHSTLVPGISLEGDGAPASDEPSLVVASGQTAVAVESSILGAIRAGRDARVHVVDSIVDATDRSAVAFSDPSGDFGAALSLEQATVIGRVKADALALVSNTIVLAALPEGGAPQDWTGPILARRTQEGCVRFSYVALGSRTPRRFRCQPQQGAGQVEPVLASTAYGAPAYCQLAGATAESIREGAEDGSEMGAFHRLQLPRREAHLRARLDEYLRFGLEAGVFHAT